MSFQSALINSRETIVNTLLGIPTTHYLNTLPASSEIPMGKSLSAELKKAVNQFKAFAMDESGEHVDYAKLADSPIYQEYRQMCSPFLRIFKPESLHQREEKLAFWINLYNALVIDAVIHFKVQNSVTEGAVGILRFFRKAAYNVGGQRFSCEDIEHGILRSNRGNPYLPGPHFALTDPRSQWQLSEVDPRIHFALNCASKSCPPIGIYTAENIDQQLDWATQNFVEHEIKIDRDSLTLHVSQILNWYQLDFGGRANLVTFIATYHPAKEWLLANQAKIKIKFAPYDWQLNL